VAPGLARRGTTNPVQEEMLMGEPLADKIMEKINQAAELYHRLVLVVAPAGAGKTAALREVQRRTGAPLINVNLELSRALLDLTERQRALQASRLLAEIVDASGAPVVLLDNTEILFDPSLRQDPLRLLQGLSRNKTVVAAWNGEIQTAPNPGASSAQPPSSSLAYATPDHPEYKRYPAHDLLVVTPEDVERRGEQNTLAPTGDRHNHRTLPPPQISPIA